MTQEKNNRPLIKRYPFPKGIKLPAWLDTHQRWGVEWILTRSRAYIAHAAGAGKTLTAIVSAYFSEGAGAVVFIVPPPLVANWVRELHKFFDSAELPAYFWPSIAVVPETTKQSFMGWAADFIVVPDSMLAKPWVLNSLVGLPIKFLAIDEASRFKEATAQRTIALFGGLLRGNRRSPGLLSGVRHTVLLDGSPMLNRPVELWAPVYACAPEIIGYMSYNDFGLRYGGPTINEYGAYEFRHSSNEAELRSKLRESFMQVVDESELNHPERRRSLLFMTKDVRTAEHKLWEKRELHNLRLEDVAEDTCKGEIATHRRTLGVAKVNWIAAYVSDLLERKNESLILFAWHREVVLALAQALAKYEPGVVMGGTAGSAREVYFRDFQAGKRKLLIMNIAAGGRGHNLQRADRVVFAEYSWCDETNKQCEKRASRRGNEKALTRCEYVVSPGTMDELMLTAVMRKASAVEKVIGK